MKNFIIVSGLLLLCSCAVFAADAPGTFPSFNLSAGSQKQTTYQPLTVSSNSQPQTFPEKIDSLENQRRALSLQMYELRVSLIKNSPQLTILQKSIMDLHEKMATQLNQDPKMQSLLAQAQKIDQQIAELVVQHNSPINNNEPAKK